MDALSSLLQLMRPRGHVFFTGEYCGDFHVDTSGSGAAHFHVISRGQCWLDTQGWEDMRPLQAGDLVMFPHDARHALRPHPPGHHSGHDEDNGYVSLICGYFEFGSRRVNPVLEALPEVIVLRDDEQLQDGCLADLLRLMRRESQGDSPGAAMAVDRLSEVLFLYVLRSVISDAPHCPRFLRAFADPPLARALTAIHDQPGRAWSVETLAQAAAQSRSAFARRFHERLGMTPVAYLTRYRMDLASEWLSQGELGIDEIAERCGYRSTAAFAKAYKQQTGITPGQQRRGSR